MSTDSPTVIYFLTKLADPERRAEYEQWVHDVDLPSVMAWDCTVNYRVIRLAGSPLPDVSAPDYDYIEIIEVTSVEAYQAAVADSPPELFEGFTSHIGPFEAAYGLAV